MSLVGLYIGILSKDSQMYFYLLLLFFLSLVVDIEVPFSDKISIAMHKFGLTKIIVRCFNFPVYFDWCKRVSIQTSEYLRTSCICR